MGKNFLFPGIKNILKMSQQFVAGCVCCW